VHAIIIIIIIIIVIIIIVISYISIILVLYYLFLLENFIYILQVSCKGIFKNCREMRQVKLKLLKFQ
jgi:hypothetical protein